MIVLLMYPGSESLTTSSVHASIPYLHVIIILCNLAALLGAGSA